MYQPGALHVLSASLTSTIAVTADVYVVIRTPSGAVVSLLASGGSSSGVVLFLSGVSVPAGLTFPMQPIISAPIPVLPFGTYTWFGAFTAPGSLSLLSNLAQTSWVLAESAPPATSPVNGIVLNFTSDQLDQGAGAMPRFCISNEIAGCSPQAGLFKSLEGLAIFNGKVWVANNGGNTPGRELVALVVQNGNVVVDAVFGSQAMETGAVVCPGGLFATSQHLWVNDQGFNDPAPGGTDCGPSLGDQGSGVGAVLRFTQPQLDAQTTDPAQIVRFSNITSRPGFGGIFVEGD